MRAADEDASLKLAGHLLQEEAETLLELVVVGRPPVSDRVSYVDPFLHPDTQRHFRVLIDAEELRAALNYPWEKWILFLHPAQRRAVECGYNGPVRISGSAGAGETIVTLHRVNQLLRQKEDDSFC